MGQVEPRRAGVVEVGQGAFLEVGFVAGLGDRALREACFFLFRSNDPIDPFWRIEPVFAQLVEAATAAILAATISPAMQAGEPAPALGAVSRGRASNEVPRRSDA